MTLLTYTYLDDETPENTNGKPWEYWADQVDKALEPFDCLMESKKDESNIALAAVGMVNLSRKTRRK